MIRSARLAASALLSSMLLAAPASADPAMTLRDLLPAGYGGDTCQAIDPGTALAAVSCGPNSLSGGPTSAIYQVFGDGATLQKAFSAVLDWVDWAVATCPGAKTPGPASLRRSDGTIYGSVACGRARTFQADRDGAVVWTSDADNFLGMAWVGYQGQSYPANLFAWLRGQVD